MDTGQDRAGINQITDVSRTKGVEELVAAFAELPEHSGSDAMLTHGSGSHIGRLDVETKVIEATDQRNSFFFILVGERNDHGAVVLYLDTCGDQRFIHCSRQAPVIADRFTGGFHLWAEISIKSLDLLE